MSSIEMKNSGVEWIGDIPIDWSIKRLKDMSFILNGGTPKSDFIFDEKNESTVYWATPTDFKDVEPSLNITKRTIHKDKINEAGNLLKENNLLISCRAPVGKVAYIKQKLSFNQGCKAVSLKNKYNTKYYFYNLIASRKYLEELAKGTTFQEISTTSFKNALYALPPLSQQTAIANYLDHHTTKIDKEISLLEQKVEKLDEYKKALIYESVTKGLDKNVPMKASGIEWIGMIPEHWEVKRVKNLFFTLKKSNISSSDADEEGKYNFYISGAKLKKSNDFNLTKESLLLPTGGSYMVHFPKSLPCAYSTDVLPIVAHKNMNLKFAYYLLSHNKEYFNENYFWGSGLKHLQRESLFNSKIIITSQSEQQQIADYLDEQCSKIDKKKELINKKTEFIKEYKQSLIYEAVTGKIKIEEEYGKI